MIKASSARQVAALVSDLGSDRAVTREAAIARLTVIGGRAVDRVSAVVDSSAAAPAVRAAALRVLEAIADARGLDHVLAALDSSDVLVATAAVSAARPFLLGASGARVVDRLTTLALATGRHEEVRLAALRALRGLEQETVAPLFDTLRTDPSASVRAEAAGGDGERPAAALERAAAHGLPDDPELLAEALLKAGAAAPLTALLRIIERVREREGRETLSRRGHWARVRGRAHVTLADRNSRLALYDLRESLDPASAPLPVDFLAALSKVGDGSCLEPLAAAYARTSPPKRNKDEEGGDWWRQHVADVFRAIVDREGLTRRHAAMKRIEARWPGVLKDLLRKR